MHNVTMSAAVIGVMGLVCAAPTLAGAPRAAVGLVEKVQAQAEAVFDTATRQLASESSVLSDDLLRTGPAARLQAKLADGTALTLGENGELLVDEFVYVPGGQDGRLALQVVSGAFLFVGGAVEDGAHRRVQIETPVATLGVRGTTVWGGFIDGAYGVLVLDGEVEVRTAGGSVTLHAGQATEVADATASPAAPHSWSAEKTARAVATISFVP